MENKFNSLASKGLELFTTWAIRNSYEIYGETYQYSRTDARMQKDDLKYIVEIKTSSLTYKEAFERYSHEGQLIEYSKMQAMKQLATSLDAEPLYVIIFSDQTIIIWSISKN